MAYVKAKMRRGWLCAQFWANRSPLTSGRILGIIQTIQRLNEKKAVVFRILFVLLCMKIAAGLCIFAGFRVAMRDCDAFKWETNAFMRD